MKTPFLGQAYVARSTNLANDRLINLYPELAPAQSGEAKNVAAFFGTPGLDLVTTIGSGPMRASVPAADGTVLYVVSGNTVYSVDAHFNSTVLGTIGTNKGPVTIIVNPVPQMALFDGALGYVLSGGSFGPISSPPFTGPVSAQYQDGFGLVNETGSSNWYQSNILDLTTWGALNFSTADSKPDNLVALGDLNREVFLFKQKECEIWINAGLPGFAFQRIDGAFIEVGIAAAASLSKCGQTLAWLGEGKEGAGVVYQLNGYEAVRISTPAIEYAIAQYPIISDAIAYSYLQEGHLFYVITFPAGNATWSYDFTTKMWHQRAALGPDGETNRHISNCYAFFGGWNLVGDYINGNLYRFNLNTYTDNGNSIKRLRSWRALQKPVFQPMTFSSLQIDMQTGINIPPTFTPQATLRWTDDGGHTWRGSRIGSAGALGATAARIMFRRLGSTRLNSGLDRVFEFSITDPIPTVLIGADLQ